MAVATFDTLKFANTLKATGMTPEQAEALTYQFADWLRMTFDELATKSELKREIEDLRRELKVKAAPEQPPNGTERHGTSASHGLLIGAPLAQQFCVIMSWVFVFVATLLLFCW